MNELTETKINNFFEVLEYLKENQKGVFGIGKNYRFDLCAFKYKGIGEGMEYEIAEDYDLEDLKDELMKPINKMYESKDKKEAIQ